MSIITLIVGAIAFLVAALGVLGLILTGSEQAAKKRREEANLANQPWDNADGRGNR